MLFVSSHRIPASSYPKHVPPDLPKQILYNGTIWQLKLVPEIDPGLPGMCQGDHHVQNGNVWLGMSFFGAHIIQIKAGQSVSEEAVSVLHEVTHVAVGPEFTCTEMTGHDAIYTISSDVIILMKQNPRLVKYLEEATKP